MSLFDPDTSDENRYALYMAILIAFALVVLCFILAVNRKHVLGQANKLGQVVESGPLTPGDSNQEIDQDLATMAKRINDSNQDLDILAGDINKL